MTFQAWSASRASLTHPDRNEDNFWIAQNRRAAAVIDGIGSYRRRTSEGEIGGEHASTMAAETLGQDLEDLPDELSLADAKVQARAAIERINTRIYTELNLSGSFSPAENLEKETPDAIMVGVALTLAMLCDGGTRLLVAQHGDTRAYVLKPSGIYQVTEDQDRLAWDVQNGLLTVEEAAEITQSLENFDGVETSNMSETAMRYLFDKNIFGELGDHPDTPETIFSVIRVDPGDRIGLLSDGAHDNLTLSEVERLINYPDDPAQTLVDMAYQRCQLPKLPDLAAPSKPYNMRATQDDITVVIIQL